MNTPSIFTFNESHNIRTVLQDGEVWFVAKDVYETLALSWNGVRTLSIIPDAWRVVVKLTTTQINQHGSQAGQLKDIHCINFKAVCKIAFRSNKPEADRFTNWAAEVMESVLKTGSYKMPAKAEKREYVSNGDMLNIKRLIYSCSLHMRFQRSFSDAIWFALRHVTGVPSPAKFEVHHLPVIAQELQRILSITEPYFEATHKAELELFKRCIRNRDDSHPVLMSVIRDMSDSTIEYQETLKLRVDKAFNAECQALIHRKPNYFDHSDCSERLTA